MHTICSKYPSWGMTLAHDNRYPEMRLFNSLASISGGSIMSSSPIPSSKVDPTQRYGDPIAEAQASQALPNRSGFRWWAGRIFLSVLALLLVLVVTTLLLGAKAKAALITAY